MDPQDGFFLHVLFCLVAFAKSSTWDLDPCLNNTYYGRKIHVSNLDMKLGNIGTTLPEYFSFTDRTVVLMSNGSIPMINDDEFRLQTNNGIMNISIDINGNILNGIHCSLNIKFIIVAIDRYSMNPSGRICQNNKINVIYNHSLVCYKDICDIVANNTHLPYNVYSGDTILVRNRYIKCNSALKCTQLSKWFLIDCMVWYVHATYMLIFILLTLLPLIIIMIICNSLKKAKVIKSENEIKLNYRYITKKNGVIRFKSNAPNKTHIKKNNKYRLALIVLFSIFKPVMMIDCSNTLDFTSKHSTCSDIQNTSCMVTTQSTFRITTSPERFCFINNGKVNNIDILDISHSCSFHTEYFVPSYEAKTEEYWRCSKTDECYDGVMQKNDSGKLYIDYYKDKNLYDGCFYSHKSCHRLYITPKKISKPCAVLKCSQIHVNIRLSMKLTDVNVTHIMQVQITDNQPIKIGNYSINFITPQQIGISDRIIRCDDYYITRSANRNGVYNPSMYGLIQCPTYESADDIDITKCKTDVASITSFLGDSIFISSADYINAEDLNHYKMKFSETLDSILQIKISTSSILTLKSFNHLEIAAYKLSQNFELNNISVHGMIEVFQGAYLSYKCSGAKLYLKCFEGELFPLICDKEFREDAITIGSAWAYGIRRCSIINHDGYSENIMIHVNVTRAEVFIGSARFVLNNIELSNDNIVSQIGFHNLLMNYFMTNIKYIGPLIVTLTSMSFLKICKSLRKEIN